MDRWRLGIALVVTATLVWACAEPAATAETEPDRSTPPAVAPAADDSSADSNDGGAKPSTGPKHGQRLGAGETYTSTYPPYLSVTTSDDLWYASEIACDNHLDYIQLRLITPTGDDQRLTIGPIRSNFTNSEIADATADQIPRAAVTTDSLLDSPALRIDGIVPVGDSFAIPGTRLGPSQPIGSKIIIYIATHPEGKYFVSIIGNPDEFDSLETAAMKVIPTLAFSPELSVSNCRYG